MHRFELDAQASLMSFDARSTVHPLHAETSGVTGWFDGDLSGHAPAIAAGELEIPLAPLASGNVIYDTELRRRLDLRRFPTLRAELGEWLPNGPAFRVRGHVTFRGVTRAEEGEMSVLVEDERTVMIEGSRVFDIRDYGMVPPSLLAIRVYPDVKVRLAIVGRRVD